MTRHDLRRVDVYDAATRKLITIAEQNQFVNYGSAASEVHLRNATQQKSRALKTVRNYRDSSLIANMDLPDLAIRAMQKEQVSNDEGQANQTLRPVQTPLDGQVAAHKQLKAKSKIDCQAEKDKLDMDLSLLKPKTKYLPTLEFGF